jgi:hypothetical protein
VNFGARAASGFLIALFMALAAYLLGVVPAMAAPVAVTDTSVSVRGRLEARDDRFFRQELWADRDVVAEWRVKVSTALEHQSTRLWLELQDQRIVGSYPPVWLDTSPMAVPATTFEDAGLRLAAALSYRWDANRLQAGRFAIKAAGGRLLGANEAAAGYRPFGVAFGNTAFANEGALVDGSAAWVGTDTWDPIVGTTTLALLRHAQAGPQYSWEAGLLGRRAPSRPLFSGLAEITATPYVYGEAALGRRVGLELLGAGQAGRRSFRPRANSLIRENITGEENGFWGRPGIYYVGDTGDRQVRAFYLRGAVEVRLPMTWEPTWSLGGHLGSGGGDEDVDRHFIPFVYDTHRFFGNAGYFGPRNSRAAFTALSVPLFAAWTARIAVWQVYVVSPREGLFLENGDRFAPELFHAGRRAAADSRDALKEWDAELRWAPRDTQVAVRLAYSEIRHGRYFSQMASVEPRRRLPPAQWAAFRVEYGID